MNRWAAVLLGVLFIPLTVLAQTISGRVTDEGQAVALAEITLLNADNVIVMKTYTDSQGRYQFVVKRGRYKIRAGKQDYAERWVKGLVVDQEDLVQDITLTPQAFVDSTVVPMSDDCD